MAVMFASEMIASGVVCQQVFVLEYLAPTEAYRRSPYHPEWSCANIFFSC